MLDWHHVGAVYRGNSDIEIYVDGRSVPANDISGNASTLAEGDPPACPSVGFRDHIRIERYFAGDIDEV